MNWLKDFVKYNLARFVNRPTTTRTISRTRGIQTAHNYNLINHHQGRFRPSVISVPSLSRKIEFNRDQVKDKAFETNGLLDIVPERQVEQRRKGKGDFEGVSEESFVHALSFTKFDLEFASFNLNDVQTIESQYIDDLSRFDEERIGDWPRGSIVQSEPVEQNIAAKFELVEKARSTVYLPRL